MDTVNVFVAKVNSCKCESETIALSGSGRAARTALVRRTSVTRNFRGVQQ